MSSGLRPISVLVGVLICSTLPAAAEAPPKVSTARAPAAAAKESAAPKSDARAETRVRRERLAAVKSWAIQLRFLDRATVARSPYDLIVMDHAPHPAKDVEAAYPADDIADLKKKSDGGRRLVLAYLSIGEAERYRYYWRASWDEDPIMKPAWLLAQNPNWPGNFYVKFADPDWQSIIFGTPQSYLDRIIAAGFDGVYLDRVDAFQDEGQPPEAEEGMVRFVSRICDHARRTDPKFLVVMQNAEELLQHANLRQRLDGIGKEDLIYGADNSAKANPADWVKDSLIYLRKARKAGMSVFTIEYVKDAESTAAVRKLNEREGFHLYIADRLLDNLKEPAGVAVPASGPAPLE